MPQGAAAEGRRGRSIWDTFAATPGKVAGGDTGATAADFYRRYLEVRYSRAWRAGWRPWRAVRRPLHQAGHSASLHAAYQWRVKSKGASASVPACKRRRVLQGI